MPLIVNSWKEKNCFLLFKVKFGDHQPIVKDVFTTPVRTFKSSLQRNEDATEYKLTKLTAEGGGRSGRVVQGAAENKKK